MIHANCWDPCLVMVCNGSSTHMTRCHISICSCVIVRLCWLQLDWPHAGFSLSWFPEQHSRANAHSTFTLMPEVWHVSWWYTHKDVINTYVMCLITYGTGSGVGILIPGDSPVLKSISHREQGSLQSRIAEKWEKTFQTECASSTPHVSLSLLQDFPGLLSPAHPPLFVSSFLPSVIPSMRGLP